MMWVDGGGVGMLQNKRDERENERRVNEGEERTGNIEGQKIAVLRGEDCSYCRGGPTATYRLHTHKCLSMCLYVHTCKGVRVCPMQGFVACVCVCVSFLERHGALTHQHL